MPEARGHKKELEPVVDVVQVQSIKRNYSNCASSAQQTWPVDKPGPHELLEDVGVLDAMKHSEHDQRIHPGIAWVDRDEKKRDESDDSVEDEVGELVIERGSEKA